MSDSLKLLEVNIQYVAEQYTYLFEKGYKVTIGPIISKISHPTYKQKEPIFDCEIVGSNIFEIRSIVKTGDEKKIRNLAEKTVDYYFKRDSFYDEIKSLTTQELILFIESRADFLNWELVSCSGIIFSLPHEFIERFLEEWHWYEISCFNKLPAKFIENFCDRLDWFELSFNSAITWKTIDKFPDKICWYQLFMCRKVSNQKLVRYCKYFKEEDWQMLAQDVDLTNKFIKKHSEKLDWDDVSHYQKLDEENISLFKEKINVEEFISNEFLEQSFKQEMCKKYLMSNISLGRQ